MPRAIVTALSFALAASLAPVGQAAAQDCMCLVPGQMPTSWLLEAQASPHAPQSIEVGPVFSSDGEMLVSGAEAEQARADDGGARAEAPVEVLWCVSSDDPRCAPRDEAPNDGPRAFDASHGASAAADAPRIADAPSAAAGPRGPETGARPGVRPRVERPPRS